MSEFVTGEWSKEEDKVLHKLWRKVTNKEIAKKLNRTEISVKQRANRIMSTESRKGKHWTPIEDDVLLKYFGNIEMDKLSDILKRTPNAILVRINQLEGSMSYSEISGHMKLKDIAEIMGLDHSTVIKYAKNGKIPTIQPSKFRYVPEDVFWEWLKINLHRVRFSNVKDSVEFICPDWYRDEIKLHKQNKISLQNKPRYWTQYEETTLWGMYNKKIPQKQIAKELNRSLTSVERKISKMKKERMKQGVSA